MKIDFYLIIVVHCKKGFSKHVANLILEQTCFFEKMMVIGDSLLIFTDSTLELLEDDKILLTEIVLGIEEVVNHRHLKTTRYTRKYA